MKNQTTFKRELRRFIQRYRWTTQDRRVMWIWEMDDFHLANTVEYIKRERLHVRRMRTKLKYLEIELATRDTWEKWTCETEPTI